MAGLVALDMCLVWAESNTSQKISFLNILVPLATASIPE